MQEEFGVPGAELHFSDALNVQVSEWFLLPPFQLPFLSSLAETKVQEENQKGGSGKSILL